jgi:predicted acylesterase/phospholipase RssA
VYILNVTRSHDTESRHPRGAFFGTKPRCAINHRWIQSVFHEPQNRQNVRVFPRTRILSSVQPDRQVYGYRSHKDRSHCDHSLIHRPEPRSTAYHPPQIGRSYRVWTDESGSCIDPLGSLRPSVCAFTSPISSVLLSKKMKYLILGPASMGIFSLIGALKARESKLADVQEISGSSAGAIIALFLAKGMSIDEILNLSLSINIPSFVKIRIGSFFNKFGFVDMGPIRKKLVDICGSDPTFDDLEMKIYVSAFCMNSGETVYFSKDTHPNMKVIDAVCMSMAVPFIFACGTYNGETYVDGGTKEQYPLVPFLQKKPHEVFCMKIKMDQRYQEKIDNPRQFVETLIRSTLSNRVEDVHPIEVLEINVKNTNIFDFNMSYEEKVRLYNLGYLTM